MDVIVGSRKKGMNRFLRGERFFLVKGADVFLSAVDQGSVFDEGRGDGLPYASAGERGDGVYVPNGLNDFFVGDDDSRPQRRKADF